jgi:DNA gyrase subunit A
MDVLPASGEPVPEPPAEGEEPEIVEAEADNEDADVVASDDRGQVLTITEKGFGKRTPVSAYRLQSRGGIGVTNIKTTEKNGKVAGIAYVFEDDQVLLITEQGMIIRTNVADIRSIGRSTQGVRVINIDENDSVVAAVKLVDKDDAEEDLVAGDSESGDSETPDDDTIH